MSASQTIACVFGNPIEQSKSPTIHALFAKQFDIDLHYIKRFAEVDAFTLSADEFFSLPNTIGANVTMPFKHDALKWVSSLSSQAKRAGAVNTIIRKGNVFEGDNTDGVGLVNDLKDHDVDLQGLNILLVGAGGAAKGVLPALIDAGTNQVSVYNRSRDKAIALVNETNHYKNDIATVYDDTTYDETRAGFDLIINATSLSLYGELPQISDLVFSNKPVVYDMVYQPSPTVFMQKANSFGCTNNIDGLGMLVNQAAQSFYLWFGHYPEVGKVHQYLIENK